MSVPPGPPAWYPDPDDPTRLRHWDGHRWDRRRDLPAWAVATEELVATAWFPAGDGPRYEGPARGVPVRPGVSPGPDGLRATWHRLVPARTRAGLGPVDSPALHGAPGYRGAGPASAWTRSRQRLVLVAAVLVAVLISSTSIIVGAVSTTPTSSPPAAGVSTLARRVDPVCAADLGQARTAGPGSAATPARSASLASVTAANAALARVATRMSRAAGTSAAPLLAPLLRSWSAYAAARRNLAAFLAGRSEGGGATAGRAGLLSASVTADEMDADRLAGGLGLPDCTLAPDAVETIP